jgi:uncharacterized protein involved in exopolysaccharide biosynthesis
MTWPNWIRAIGFHKGLALGVFVSTQVVFTGAWFAAPHFYKADALIVFAKTGMQTGTVTETAQGQNLASRVALLGSRMVTDRVVARLGLSEPLRPTWEALPVGERLAFDDWLFVALSSGLVPSRSLSPYLLSVGYASASPEMSAGLANAYATELQDVIGLLSRRDEATVAAVMDVAVKDARNHLHAAQDELMRLNREDGILSEGLLDDGYRIVRRASRQSGNTRTAAIESSVTQAVVAQLRQRGSLLDDTMIKDLKADLRALEVAQAGALARLGASHPEVKSLESRIEALQRKVAQQESARVLSVGASADIDRRVASASEDTASQATGRVMDTLAQRYRYDAANQRMNDAGDGLADALTQVSVMSLLADAPTVDVRVLQQATLPLTYWMPRPEIVFGVSVVSGFLFMVLAASLSERFGVRVRDADQLKALLGQEVIGRFSSGPVRPAVRAR